MKISEVNRSNDRVARKVKKCGHSILGGVCGELPPLLSKPSNRWAVVSEFILVFKLFLWKLRFLEKPIMNYQDRVICFLDILGFKGCIKKTICPDGSEAEEEISKVSDALHAFWDVLAAKYPGADVEKEVTQFSDSVVISFPAIAESGVYWALLDLMWVQINLVYRGLLCRGGISRGKLVHTDKYLFGPAMNHAYILESKVAMYPRIILDESIVNTGMNAPAKHHGSQGEKESIMDLLARDADGMYFIDYITKAQSELNDPEWDYPDYLYRLREIISSGLDISDPSVAIKYRWLKEKYLSHLSVLKANIKDLEDINLREAYEGIPDL